MPPPEPVPFDGGPLLPSGSPNTAMFTSGIDTSGAATMVGSISSRGASLCITAAGGVNCRGATRGSRPRLAGSTEPSPPPPPPRAGAGLGAAGKYGSTSGVTTAAVLRAMLWMVPGGAMVSSSAAAPL